MNAALAESATAATFTTPDGFVIRPDWLVRGLAKLSATREHLPADATDHVVVFDVATGLMEAVSAPGFDARMEHDEASAKVSTLVHAGFTDWQLPDVPEAIHSVDYTRMDPACDIGLYPDMVAASYWTRQQTKWTEDEAGSSRSFFYVSMLYGGVNHHIAYYRLRARPVRRAAPASQCLVIGQ